MQYYLNDKKLNKIEKQKAEKDGLKIFEELDDYALKGWEEMDEVDLQMRLKWYGLFWSCLLYTSPSPRDRVLSRMPSSA